eukprot:4985347-Prymnesium_polylepis.1
MARRHLLSATAGAAAGLATGAWLWGPQHSCDNAAVSPHKLTGTYELTSCSPTPAGRVTGLMVHSPNGVVSMQVVVKVENKLSHYVGYSGRWYSDELAPLYAHPHASSKPCVEHHIRAASLPTLVGKTLRQEYELSPDHNHLTTSNVRIMEGGTRQVATLQWQRLDGQHVSA